MKRFALTIAAASMVFGFASMASANDDLAKFLQQLKGQQGQQQGGQPQQKMVQPGQQGGQQQGAMMMVGPGPGGMPFQRWRLGIVAMNLNNPWDSGVYISQVDPFGPCSRVYLSPHQIVALESGDRILQVDGQQVFGTDSLRHILNQNNVGWAVMLIRDVRTFQIRQVYVQLEPVGGGGGGGPVVMMNQGGQQQAAQQQQGQQQIQGGLQNFLQQRKKK